MQQPVFAISIVGVFIIHNFHFVIAGYNINGIIMGDNDIFMKEFDGNMRYQHCDGLQSVIQLNYMETNTKQFFVPQNFSLSIDFELLKDLLPPISMELKVSKKLPFFGYIKLPCIGHVGSCTYDNGCDILDTYSNDTFSYRLFCPKWLRATGIECKCPFKKGRYSTLNAQVAIEETIIPKWIATGDYKVVLTINDAEQAVGCFKFQFRLN